MTVKTYSEWVQHIQTLQKMNTAKDTLNSILTNMSDTYSTNTGGKTQVFSPGEHNQYIYPACNELLLSDEDVAKYLTYGATHVDNKRLETSTIATHLRSKEFNQFYKSLFERSELGVNFCWQQHYRKQSSSQLVSKGRFADNLKANMRSSKPEVETTEQLEGYILHGLNVRSHHTMYLFNDVSKQTGSTFCAYLLLITNLVHDEETIQTMKDILKSNGACNTAISHEFPKEWSMVGVKCEEYTPFVGMGQTWAKSDRHLIDVAFLRPQNTIHKMLVAYLRSGKNSKFPIALMRTRATCMIAKDWLHIVNLLGYLVQPTTYMKTTFPIIAERLQKLTEKSKTPIMSNLDAVSELLGELAFKSGMFTLPKKQKQNFTRKESSNVSVDWGVDKSWLCFTVSEIL